MMTLELGKQKVRQEQKKAARRKRAALAEEETRTVAKLILPRTTSRPQNACGRCCPWEPTALKLKG
jgi:hypothetical protein